jgi:hypothetical protein
MRMSIVVAGLIACSSSSTQHKPSAPVVEQAPGTPNRGEHRLEHGLARGLEPPVPTLRLPRNFLPASYTATLAIDPARSSFDGTIAIAGNVSEPSSVIWLHGRHLKITRAVAAIADRHAIPLHIDGARFWNAVVAQRDAGGAKEPPADDNVGRIVSANG